MFLKNINISHRSIIIIFLAALITGSVVYAWTEPTTAPPGGDVWAPINTGPYLQRKDGTLVLRREHDILPSLETHGNTYLAINSGQVLIATTTSPDSDPTSDLYRALFVDGDVGIPGNKGYWHDSDERLKSNITPIESSLQKVLNLEGVSYNWKGNDKPLIGLVAQDVEPYFPEVVSTGSETGLKTLEYSRLVAPLIEAIKEQQVQINKLRAEIEELKLKQ